jgi:hypothetical protein
VIIESLIRSLGSIDDDRSWEDRLFLCGFRTRAQNARRTSLHRSLIQIQDGQLDIIDSWKDVEKLIEVHRLHQNEDEQDSNLVSQLQSRMSGDWESCWFSEAQAVENEKEVIQLKYLLRQYITNFDFSQSCPTSKADDYDPTCPSKSQNSEIFTKDRFATLAARDRQQWLREIQVTIAQLESQDDLYSMLGRSFHAVRMATGAVLDLLDKAVPDSLKSAIDQDAWNDSTINLETWIADTVRNENVSGDRESASSHPSAAGNREYGDVSALSRLHALYISRINIRPDIRLSAEVYLPSAQNVVEISCILTTLPLESSIVEDLKRDTDSLRKSISEYQLQKQLVEAMLSQR